MPSIINTAINTAIGFPLCVLTFFIAIITITLFRI